MWPSFGKHCFSWVRTRVYGQPALRRWPDNKEGSALREASTTVRGNTTAANSLFKLEYFGVRRPVGALVAGDLSPAASRQGMPQRGYGLQPGLPLRLPWVKKALLSSTATRLRLLGAFLSEKTSQPRCG